MKSLVALLVNFLQNSFKIKNNSCIFCEENETAQHYYEHGFNDEQISYVLNKKMLYLS